MTRAEFEGLKDRIRALIGTTQVAEPALKTIHFSEVAPFVSQAMAELIAEGRVHKDDNSWLRTGGK